MRRHHLESGPSAASQDSLPFVAGPENRLVGHALRSLFEATASDYSPLVLYGPHGVGKSHLVGALVEWWHAHHPERRVCALSATDFARELARVVAGDGLEAWRREMASADLFVLEDLAQLSTKRSAQHELVELLDVLADRRALVVLTSRSLPNHLGVLLPELRSRLSAGLAVPLSLPGPAARRSILARLAAIRGLSLPRRAIHGLADALDSNVPTLASALPELDLRARVDKQPIDRRRLRLFISQRDQPNLPNLREIAAKTAKYFGLSVASLKSPERRQPLVMGRGVAMYLARQLTGKSLQEIGKYFGGRDHTTVLHGCRRTEGLLAQDPAVRQAVAELRRLLNAS